MQLFHILRQNKVSLFSSILLCAMPIICSYSIGYYMINAQNYFQSLSTIQWAGIYFVSIFTMGFALTPTTFVSILSGFLIGWNSIPAVIISYLSASLVCFLFAKKLDGGKFIKSLQGIKSINQTLENIKKEELKIVILSKLSPILPFALSNVLLSISKVSIGNFLIGGLIGMLPRTLTSIWLGISAQNIQQIIEGKVENSYTHWVVIVLAIISVFGLARIFKKALSK